MHDAPLTMPAQFLRLRRLSLKKATRPAELARWAFIPLWVQDAECRFCELAKNLRPWRTREWAPCDTYGTAVGGGPAVVLDPVGVFCVQRIKIFSSNLRFHSWASIQFSSRCVMWHRGHGTRRFGAAPCAPAVPRVPQCAPVGMPQSVSRLPWLFGTNKQMQPCWRGSYFDRTKNPDGIFLRILSRILSGRITRPTRGGIEASKSERGGVFGSRTSEVIHIFPALYCTLEPLPNGNQCDVKGKGNASRPIFPLAGWPNSLFTCFPFRRPSPPFFRPPASNST